MKPLARWTFGNAKPAGLETLRYSIRRFKSLYPEFDSVVCYNNLAGGQLVQLKDLGVDLYEQNENEVGWPLASVNLPPGHKGSMPGWGWKLAPPRLRIDAYEIWIDNDIIFNDRLPTLDNCILHKLAVIGEDRGRNYGAFDELVKCPIPCCAGLFGLPPYFDFASAIKSSCKILDGPLGYYHEQGLVVSIVTSQPFVIIRQTELLTVKSVKKPYPPAMHFIGVNRADDHLLWNQFKCCITM